LWSELAGEQRSAGPRRARPAAPRRRGRAAPADAAPGSEELVLAAEDLGHRVVGEDPADGVGEHDRRRSGP
jgi:hypothetical protein